jgi:predicted kinase
MEEPARKPALVLVTGLPGTGKSTLARAVAERAGFQVIRSDVVRKELAGGAEDRYTPEWGRKTYAECARRAEGLLFEGQRVLVDANFRQEKQRRLFLDLAARGGVPAILFVCRVEPEVIKERLAERSGDASDANWEVYQMLAHTWEEPSETTRRSYRALTTGGERTAAVAEVLDALRQMELA